MTTNCQMLLLACLALVSVMTILGQAKSLNRVGLTRNHCPVLSFAFDSPEQTRSLQTACRGQGDHAKGHKNHVQMRKGWLLRRRWQWVSSQFNYQVMDVAQLDRVFSFKSIIPFRCSSHKSIRPPSPAGTRFVCSLSDCHLNHFLSYGFRFFFFFFPLCARPMQSNKTVTLRSNDFFYLFVMQTLCLDSAIKRVQKYCRPRSAWLTWLAWLHSSTICPIAHN